MVNMESDNHYLKWVLLKTFRFNIKVSMDLVQSQFYRMTRHKMSYKIFVSIAGKGFKTPKIKFYIKSNMSYIRQIVCSESECKQTMPRMHFEYDLCLCVANKN